MASKEDINSYDDENIVKDDLYILNEERGGEEYNPAQNSDETQAELNPGHEYEFRDFTKKTMREQGLFQEDEREDETINDDEELDTQRRLSSFVAASHRKERSPQDRQVSAEKASQLHKELTGYELEIDDEGRVLVDKPILK